MGLFDVAVDAWGNSMAGLEGEARQAIETVLEGWNAGGMTRRFVRRDATVTMFVFSDEGPPEVALSVRQSDGGWRVDLVRWDDGWTQVAGPITSIVGLGEILDGLPPQEPSTPTYPEWYQRWAPDGWSEGDRVVHGGFVWEASAGGVGGNTWEPGVYGWVKVV